MRRLIGTKVDLVIPLRLAQYGIIELNAAIPAWAASQNTTASPIWISDCNTGFTSAMVRDGAHPNAQGDALIASRISPVLISVINKKLGRSPVPSGDEYSKIGTACWDGLNGTRNLYKRHYLCRRKV